MSRKITIIGGSGFIGTNLCRQLALKQKDFATRNFIQWFVDEQIEEEQKFETILQKFDLLGRDKLAIYEINKLLGASTSSTEE